jgi:hypothetical protein
MGETPSAGTLQAGAHLGLDLLLIAQLEFCLAPPLCVLVNDIHPRQLLHCCRDEPLHQTEAMLKGELLQQSSC